MKNELHRSGPKEHFQHLTSAAELQQAEEGSESFEKPDLVSLAQTIDIHRRSPEELQTLAYEQHQRFEHIAARLQDVQKRCEPISDILEPHVDAVMDMSEIEARAYRRSLSKETQLLWGQADAMDDAVVALEDALENLETEMELTQEALRRLKAKSKREVAPPAIGDA